MKAVTHVLAPLRMFDVRAALPDISVIGGIAVAGSHPTPAVAYDFNFVQARARLIAKPSNASRVVRVRMANDLSELPPPEGDLEYFVLAPGEQVITEPQAHGFRYIMVYEGEAVARAVQ